MAKKKLNIVLGVALLSVWALVMYKLFWKGGGEEPIPFTAPSYVESSEQVVPDSIVLDLDYRDPFLGASKKKRPSVSRNATTAQQTPVRNTPTIETTLVEVDKWPKIEYSGIIENAQSNRQVALVLVDGQSYLLSPGDTVQGMILNSVSNDSILVECFAESRVVGKRKP